VYYVSPKHGETTVIDREVHEMNIDNINKNLTVSAAQNGGGRTKRGNEMNNKTDRLCEKSFFVKYNREISTVRHSGLAFFPPLQRQLENGQRSEAEE
jgi:hypothetical protein